MTKGKWVVETTRCYETFDTYEDAKEFYNECLQAYIPALAPEYEEYDDGEDGPIIIPCENWCGEW